MINCILSSCHFGAVHHTVLVQCTTPLVLDAPPAGWCDGTTSNASKAGAFNRNKHQVPLLKSIAAQQLITLLSKCILCVMCGVLFSSFSMKTRLLVFYWLIAEQQLWLSVRIIPSKLSQNISFTQEIFCCLHISLFSETYHVI